MEPMRFLVTEAETENRLRGKLLSGLLQTGINIVLSPGGQQSAVTAIHNPGGEAVAEIGEADTESTLTLDAPLPDPVGKLIAAADARPEYADQFESHLDWSGDDELLPGRTYQLEAPGGQSIATVSRLKYRLNNDLQIAAKTLARGESGVVNLALNRPISFDANPVCAATNQFLLRDKETGQEVARGRIHHSLRRASNVHWQALDVDKQSRAGIKQQTPRIVWLTGLSGSGKSTVANMVEKKLLALGRHSYLLDGDNVRHGLNKDLGFTDADRVENIRRVAETAKLMLDAGLIVITSFISPFRAERDMARSLFDDGEFIEVHVNTSLEVCEQRDPKGLYRKARKGEIKNFTGLDSPYEEPEGAELTLDTHSLSVEEAADLIIDYLEQNGV